MRTVSSQMTDARLLYEFLAFEDPLQHADVIIATGSHDLRVAEYAAQQYFLGAARLVVCSGGYGKITNGMWNRPEGAVFAERCMELGVPERDVLVEPKAANSGENFTFSRELLKSVGLLPTTGVIVSKPYMAKRAWATATKQWPEVTWSVRPPRISFEDYPSDDTPLERMINLMVGDLQRLRVYAENGFQAPVAIPDDVWSAYERLANDGYTTFVISP